MNRLNIAIPCFVFLCFAKGSAEETARNERTLDRAQIKNAAVQFVEAYNEHDAKRVAALFADDGELVERNGKRFTGRDEIANAFNSVFTETPEAKISVAIESVRFVTADVAIEEGSATWFPDGKTPTTNGVYRVAHVKRDGKWLMAGVRTLDGQVLTSYEYLRDLEWMVGEWIDESGMAVVTTKVRWGPNRTFLLREFSVKVDGRTTLSGTQRIGWDARNKQFRSWVFDSEGGYVDGRWTRVGNGYIIRSVGYLQDGTAVSGTSRIDRLGNDRISWSMFNRLRGDEIMPDVDLIVVRKPPSPAEAK